MAAAPPPLVGRIGNWSQEGVALNRDASPIFHDAEICINVKSTFRCLQLSLLNVLF
jgi:hypothetical protein